MIFLEKDFFHLTFFTILFEEREISFVDEEVAIFYFVIFAQIIEHIIKLTYTWVFLSLRIFIAKNEVAT